MTWGYWVIKQHFFFCVCVISEEQFINWAQLLPIIIIKPKLGKIWNLFPFRHGCNLELGSQSFLLGLHASQFCLHTTSLVNASTFSFNYLFLVHGFMKINRMPYWSLAIHTDTWYTKLAPIPSLLTLGTPNWPPYQACRYKMVPVRGPLLR